MPEICQNALPVKPWLLDPARRLPGLSPVGPGEWLQVDDAYSAQIGYKGRIIAEQGDQVCRVADQAGAAATELLARILDELRQMPGFSVEADRVTCPDGRRVALDRARPLQTCGALVQEDLCILQKQGDEHVLTAALLCFPASWSLAQKFMRPLTAIHAPVDVYDDNIAKRVQRLFDGIQVARPIWRANFLVYSDPDLFQPRTEEDRRKVDTDGPKWVRVERQSLLKLEQTGAVVFSIHTYIVPFSGLSREDIRALGNP